MGYYEEVIVARLDEILSRVRALERFVYGEGKVLMAAIDDLTTAVAEETTVDASVLKLIQGLAAQIAAANAAGSNDPKIEALVAQINANAASLQAAVTANTPAPAPVPAPVAPTTST